MVTYYDEIAKSYNELYETEQRKKLEVIKSYLDGKKIAINPNIKILDVGCGTGISQDFFERNYDADTFGIDPSEGLLKQNNYQCMLGEAEELDFEDDEFDIVVSITCLQNFKDIDKGLKEIKRVGKGLFIITFLKKSENIELMENKIKENFEIVEKIEEEKDLIFILN